MAVSSSRDFGSFHVSNVEALLEAPFSLEYPFERPQRSRPRDFGEDAKSTLFFLSDDFTFLNHGAFGGVARPCLETANEWRRYVGKVLVS
uniref:Uncharacterized protein n=1 Tax=Chromera velia CCMP2878 TaxID=1169474 RepID=A0A0G4GLT9_9ALVE|eukprot:Cvel_4892.t1-p1 / transcript=Cvel_4892.t1 / gene=Cvel_4892 / organism=Chromera_velia_CCMP2878 / gene_product=hypothetical protein / transcript_product=hypothetical protein / location=Cvel_scaffold220:101191-101457(-) / protein_length=89 / sequence_SO=supercontig / SO=protein_coding / is_pseudo=false